MNDQARLAGEWRRLASRTAAKVNTAWWLQQAGPALVITGMAGCALVLWLRSRHDGISPAQLWPWLAAGLAVVLAAGYWLARRHFINSSQAMVRLESELRLHNALTAAAAGRCAWPALPSSITDGWRWRWEWVAGPLAAAAAFLALGLWLPLTPDAQAAATIVEPQSWAQMDEWLEKLEEDKIITPEEKEEQAARIAELRDQPQDKWFSHESLNASDTLKEQLRREITQLGQQMSNAGRSLNALENYADQLSPAAKDQLLKDFDEAVSGLQSGALDLDPALLKELAQIDPKNLKSLSPEQLKELRESLKKKSGSCQGMCDKPGFLGDGEGEDDELAEIMRLMKKQGQGLPGNGGLDRGPGTAPLTLSDEENDFGTDKNEAVSNNDLSRAQLGSTIGIKDGKHEVDKTPTGPAAAGSVQNTGQGGEQVWKESLTPAEKAVLKRVFQ